jgi:hypothetical protein
VQYAVDTDFGFTSVWLCSEMVLLVLLGWFVWDRRLRNGEQPNRSSSFCQVVDDKSQAVPQARIETRAEGQLLATELTDAAGGTTATMQGPAGLQLTVSKQGYLATSTVLETKTNTRRMPWA